MPELVRFYIRHSLIGFAIAAAFVAGLLWFNVANLWHLVSTSDVGVLAVVLLVVFHGIVFSGVQFGMSIMRLGEDDRDPGPGHHGRVGALIPVRVERDRPRR